MKAQLVTLTCNFCGRDWVCHPDYKFGRPRELCNICSSKILHRPVWPRNPTDEPAYTDIDNEKRIYVLRRFYQLSREYHANPS